MILTARQETAIAICIALQGKSDPVSVDTIAPMIGYSRSQTEVIAIRLKRGGVLGAVRGANGGYYLLRDASHTTLLQIVNCIPLSEGQSRFYPDRSVRVYMDKLDLTHHNYLVKTTLADLMFKPV